MNADKMIKQKEKVALRLLSAERELQALIRLSPADSNARRDDRQRLLTDMSEWRRWLEDDVERARMNGHA